MTPPVVLLSTSLLSKAALMLRELNLNFKFTGFPLPVLGSPLTFFLLAKGKQNSCIRYSKKLANCILAFLNTQLSSLEAET